MKGSLTQIGPDHWRLRVYIGRRNGKPVQVSKNHRGKKRAAETELARYVADVTDRENPNPETITVGGLLDRWLERLKATPYTVKGYRYMIDASLKPALGEMRLAKVTTRHLDDTYHQWLEEGVSPATVRKRHTVLSASFRQAVKWGLLRYAPTDNTSPPSSHTTLSRVMSPAEVQALVRAAEEEDPMLGCAVALAALTGARRGELCALRWSDCELQAGRLRIARSLTRVDQVSSEGPTKTHQERRISLDPVAAEVIRRRMEQQAELAQWDGGGLVDDPFLLSRRADGATPCLPNGLSHAFRRVADRLGLPYHLHETRHFAASMMLAGGVDPRTTATRLGHAQPAITMRTYGHMIGSADERAAGVLGALLSVPVNVKSPP